MILKSLPTMMWVERRNPSSMGISKVFFVTIASRAYGFMILDKNHMEGDSVDQAVFTINDLKKAQP